MILFAPPSLTEADALNAGGSLSLQMAGTTYVPNGFFDLLVRDTQGDLRRRDVPGRGGGAFLSYRNAR